MGKRFQRVTLLNTPKQIFEPRTYESERLRVNAHDNQLRVDTSYPIGLMYIASVLRQNGIDVSYVDANFYQMSPQETLEAVGRTQPDLVGMNIVFPNSSVVLDLAKSIKQYLRTRTVVGGPGASLMHDKIINHSGVDYVVRKEGEFTARDLCGDIPIDQIKGLTWKNEDGKPQHNPERPFLQNLDELPFPSIDLVPPEILQEAKVLSMFTTRGCPSKCVFCSTPELWEESVRYRSVPNITAEIDWSLEQHPEIEQVHMLDDTFTIKKGRLHEFCDAFIKGGYAERLEWRCLSRVNVNEYDLQHMKDSNCTSVSFGVESGSPRVIKLIKKGITLDQVRTAFRAAKKVGIHTKAFFMVGFPWETEEDIRATLDFAEEIAPDDVAFNVAKAYPRTTMYAMVADLYGQEPIAEFTNMSGSSEGDPEVERHIDKYSSIPWQSCNPRFTVPQLVEFAREGYRRVLGSVPEEEAVKTRRVPVEQIAGN